MFKIPIFIITFVFSLCSYANAVEEKWNEKKSTHFIIYYKEAPEDFANRVVEATERYYNEIIEDMGFSRYENFWLWDNRAKIYIYDNQQDYAKKSGQPGWAGGHVFSQGKVIWTYPWAAGFFDTLLPHEMGHIIFRELIGYRSDVPIWLDEGVACYQERARRWGALEKIKQAIAENRFINFETLNNLKPQQINTQDTIDLFYAESANIVAFLIEKYGKYRFKTFINALKDKKDFNSALSSTFYDLRSLNDLGRVWERNIKEGK